MFESHKLNHSENLIHPFSKYIDTDFSYKGDVSSLNKQPINPLIFFDTFVQRDNNNKISLEPRLHDYIMKKKFYKANNITDILSLKKTYQITKQDIIKIRDFLDKQKKYKKKIIENRKEEEEKKFNDYGKKYIDHKKIAEHRFQYVNPKIINPILGVEVWDRGGVSSRLDNRKSSRISRGNTRDLF